MDRRLILGVINQLGFTEEDLEKIKVNDELHSVLNDVINHGAISGFSGFIYYSDTVRFFEAFKNEIFDMIYDYYNGNLKDFFLSLRGLEDIGSYDQFANLLSWVTLETVALHIINKIGEEDEY